MPGWWCSRRPGTARCSSATTSSTKSSRDSWPRPSRRRSNEPEPEPGEVRAPGAATVLRMITKVPGIEVGHWTDPIGLTGCTVVLCPPGTLGSGEVRGGAPGTRETDLLRPGMTVDEVHAVLLTGGSAFGLAAADGVMRFLEERGVGFDTGVARVPIVPAAVLFDLGIGDPKARPGPDAGYEACRSASDEVEEGNVGAGTGATVANLFGSHRALKGGLGTASTKDGDLIVGALAAVNAFGELIDDQGELMAGARPAPEGEDQPPPAPNAGAERQSSTRAREGQVTEGTT